MTITATGEEEHHRWHLSANHIEPGCSECLASVQERLASIRQAMTAKISRGLVDHFNLPPLRTASAASAAGPITVNLSTPTVIGTAGYLYLRGKVAEEG